MECTPQPSICEFILVSGGDVGVARLLLNKVCEPCWRLSEMIDDLTALDRRC
jgi:hypothetical protein